MTACLCNWRVHRNHKMTAWCSHAWDFMLPKRRFWTAEQSVACAFLQYFSRMWVLALGYHWLKTLDVHKMHAWCVLDVHKMHACLMCVRCSQYTCMHTWFVFDVHKMHAYLICVLDVHKMHGCVLNVHKMHACLMCVRCSQYTCMCVRCSQDACMPDVCTMLTIYMHAWCVLDVHKMHAWCVYDVHNIHACAFDVHKMHACPMCVRCSQDACMPDLCTMFTRCMPDVCVCVFDVQERIFKALFKGM